MRDETLALVRRIAGHRGALETQDIAKWTGRAYSDRRLNGLALGIARAYDGGALPFAEAAATMDDLAGLVTRLASDGDAPEVRLPSPFWDIYEAFDEGTYPHGDTDDPETEFTRPKIAAILADEGRP